MKSFYIFLSLIFIFLSTNGSLFAQNEKTNQKIVHKTIDKMNYEFAIAVLGRMNQLDENVKFTTQKLKDTTFTQVEKLKPRVQAQSLERLFSDKKLSDGVTGYIYDIDFIKKSSKYPTDDLPSTIKSLDKIVSKITSRVTDFGEKQSKFKLTAKQFRDLKLRLNKIKNSAVNELNPNEEETVIQADTTQKNSAAQAEIKEETTQIASSEIIYYKINQEEEKELTGTNETTEGEKPTYQFSLDVKKTDSIQIRVKGNSDLDTAFLVANTNNSLILEGKDNRYIVDLNVATTQEDDYIMWIIFLAIAAFVIIFVLYKQGQKDKPDSPKEVIKKDPLSRNDAVTQTVISTNQKTENKERQTVIAQNKNQTENQIQNQIQEEKQRLTTLLTNPKLSDTQKLKEARSKNVIIEVANNLEIKELMRVIEELSTKSEIENTAKEPIKDQPNKEEITTQKIPPKNTKNYHEPLYVSLSDINKIGIKSERKKGMSNTIFMIRPYSEGETEAKKADLMLHSDIKDMAFESIFRSIEQLDYIIEYNTLDQNVKKITQEEKGVLIKEDDIWKVKKRLKVKFS